MPDYVLMVPDVFEQGFAACTKFLNDPKLFPAIPLNPYDPSTHIGLYDEWESGYEYAGYLSTRPDVDTKGPTTNKVQRLFGPFQSLLLPPPQNKENPSP